MALYTDQDPYLSPYATQIETRHHLVQAKLAELVKGHESINDFANGHHYFGIHQEEEDWVCREWAPNAQAITLVGDRMGWENPGEKYHYKTLGNGLWELRLKKEALKHGDLVKLNIEWPDGAGLRLPLWSTRVVQDEESKLFSAQIWKPNKAFEWKHERPKIQADDPVLIYEAHVGMSGEEGRVNSFSNFTADVLPRIAQMGYNVIQLMAIQEHPYYGSFGYHVSNFFAASSRFGTPEDLKELIDEAHARGIRVIMDIVHSHAVKNVLEGPGLFDGSQGMLFHNNHRREHPAWDSLCFDYGKNETLHFLLSNCKFWVEEYQFDGYRFDGITSMLYFDHGLERAFTSYDQYFDASVDQDAWVYLALANQLLSELHPDSIRIAEDMSGIPGLGAAVESGGLGFTHRLAMGIPDFWIKYIKEKTDELWNVSEIFYQLTNKRPEERTISYAESHDQALVGDKTLIFRLADKEMYTHMAKSQDSLIIDRAMALHKLIRLITLCTHGGGYLNFMGNEFGHPEWIDFPREGNNWSYHYARRQWSLADNDVLRYQELKRFDEAMLSLANSGALSLSSHPESMLHNEGDQVLAFKRNDFLFVFNFNPTQSFTDYGIPCFPDDYKIVLHSDQEVFGGYNRVDCSIVLETIPVAGIGSEHRLMCYLPSRTAMVLQRVPTPSVRPK